MKKFREQNETPLSWVVTSFLRREVREEVIALREPGWKNLARVW